MTNLEKKVINLTAPTRRGMKVTCTWDVPSACLKSDAKAKVRFDGLDMLWVFDAKKNAVSPIMTVNNNYFFSRY